MHPKHLFAVLGLTLPAMALSQTTAKTQLAGYFYGKMPAPTHWEWQCPDSLAYNKQEPKAWFFSFSGIDKARNVLPEYSNYYRSLDGSWKFHWAKNPSERPVKFYEPSFNVSNWDDIHVPLSWNLAGSDKKGGWKYGRPIYSNQRVIFEHHIKVGDWKGGVMRTPPKDWLTYEDRNEVGSYRRTFTIPSDWEGREIYINFDAVDSFFYIWINGHYVGFSKNSRNLACFDITPYLKKGENIVAVEVYRSSDGSFLESQDMFRLPGINRDVYLTAKPKVQVRDCVIIPTFTDNAYKNGALDITAYVANLTRKEQKKLTLDYSLYEVELFGDRTQPTEIKGSVLISDIAKNTENSVKYRLNAGAVKAWSSERPQRYVLVGQLKDKKGKVIETFSSYVGFRQIEIKNTPANQDEFGLAGRYYYLNGQPIKFKGVNRHETNPLTGHAIGREQLTHEVMMMKRANINHVRNSHYPERPYWYILCDKYGIYLEDEANIESHEYYYGDPSLSHVKEFRNAHVARNLEMVHANVNHPSIVIWSLGNEAGPGKNFEYAYQAIKKFDLSRPVQYERNNDIVDMGSNQYPSVQWVEAAATGKINIKYPFHISEYAHSMGNAVGDLVNYWKAIESSNYVMGGAIWDWVDQAMYNYDPKTGKRYWGYGGDFNDKPNDGMFCMNGLLRPNFTPKAQYFEVKKVYQNVGITLIDAKQRIIRIHNKNYFVPLTGYNVYWSLWKDGKQVGEEHLIPENQVAIAPRKFADIKLPIAEDATKENGEYFVKVQFKLAQNEPWAKAGYVQMEEQLPLQLNAKHPNISSLQLTRQARPHLNIIEGKSITINGVNFDVVFNPLTATIDQLSYNGKTMIENGNGPTIDAFRAPTDNDIWVKDQWFSNGLNNLKQKVLSSNIQYAKDGSIVLNFHLESQAPYSYYDPYSDRDRNPGDVHKAIAKTNHPMGPDDFKFISNIIYTVYPDGSIALRSSINSNRPQALLARIGYKLSMPKNFNVWSYYGRGPINNYSDRKTGQFIELYNTPVDSSFIVLPKPQSMGNREDLRWMAITDKDGDGILFRADSTFSGSVLPWSQLQLMGAAHIYQLPPSDGTYIHIDAKVQGLGGASCGPTPLNVDLVKAKTYPSVGFLIRPVEGHDQVTKANVNNDGLQPLAFNRDRIGNLTIINPRKDVPVYYSLNGAKPQLYKGTFNFKQGGTIKAYYKDAPKFTFSQPFVKIDRIPLEVIYVSSYEPGNPASNLLDGNPGSIWHTQYGITLAKYPHWIDFDAAEPKLITGFVYVPRTDGSSNGNIKDYEIYISNDNKNWTLATKGTFPNGGKPAKVMLSKPIKGRYIRFKALNEQNGNDYASGAEFEVLSK